MNWVVMPRNIVRHSLSDVSHHSRVASDNLLTHEVGSEPAVLPCALDADRLVSHHCNLVSLRSANKNVSAVLNCSIILEITVCLLFVAEANI